MKPNKKSDKCPRCAWSWLRVDCKEGRDETGRWYCRHAECEHKWHDRKQEF